MNFLLLLNKNYILIFTLLTSITILFLVSFFYYQLNSTNNIKNVIEEKIADITKPKFSINSDKQNIYVTANEGNFVTENEILLENNVIFKSNKFKIYTDNVVFNKKNLVASSKNKSKFISKRASIDSIGFDITKNGNIINFKGKTKLTLK